MYITLCTVLYTIPHQQSQYWLTGVSIGFPLWLSSKFNESLPSGVQCSLSEACCLCLSSICCCWGRETTGAGALFGLYTAAARRGGRKTIIQKGLKLRKDRGRVAWKLFWISVSSVTLLDWVPIIMWLPGLSKVCVVRMPDLPSAIQNWWSPFWSPGRGEGIKEYPFTLLLQRTVIENHLPY